MTREDLKRFCALDIDFESIGLMEPGLSLEPYFCTPMNAEPVGRLGCDGIHFVLLPGDERVFCVGPRYGEPGDLCPASSDRFSGIFVLCPLLPGCQPPLPDLVADGRTVPGTVGGGQGGLSGLGVRHFLLGNRSALERIARAFDLAPAAPYQQVKALQAAFDPRL